MLDIENQELTSHFINLILMNYIFRLDGLYSSNCDPLNSNNIIEDYLNVLKYNFDNINDGKPLSYNDKNIKYWYELYNYYNFSHSSEQPPMFPSSK